MLLDSSLRLAALLALMGALALLETVIPLQRPVRGWAGRAPNLALTALFFFLNLGLTAAAVGAAASVHGVGPGLLQRLPGGAGVVAGVLALDFCAYIAHVLLHKVPALWRIHRVHHSDESVDVTTAYRQHPLETLLRFGFTWGPALLLGIGAEATAAYRLLSGINALLEHANLRVAPWLERSLSAWVVTPDMHKLHHSCVARETDSNYGNLVPWFDRLFRTYRPPGPAVTYGLGLPGDAHRSWLGLLRLPFRQEAHARHVAR